MTSRAQMGREVKYADGGTVSSRAAKDRKRKKKKGRFDAGLNQALQPQQSSGQSMSIPSGIKPIGMKHGGKCRGYGKATKGRNFSRNG